MKKHVKRYLSLALTLALVFAIPFAFTQEASAASGSKVKQPVLVTQTSQTSSGVTTEATTYVYDKKGLNTEIVYSDGTKRAYTYSKKGLIKTWNRFSKTGACTSYGVNNVRGSKYISSASYYMDNGQAVLDGTTTYAYKKGKIVRENWMSANGRSSSVTYYNKKGKLKKYIYVSGTYSETRTYDKKGNIVSDVETSTAGTETVKYANTYKKGKLVKCVSTYTDTKGVVTPLTTTVYSYNKKGRVKKSVSTNSYNYTSTDAAGNPVTYTDTTTDTTTYAYNKSGLPTNITETYTSTDGELKTTTTSTYVTTIAYKNFKVNSKVKKAVKERVQDFADSYLPF